MNAMFKGAAVLEVNENRSKDGSKLYQSLIVFEPGQKFPEIKKVSFTPEQMNLAKSLVGKKADVECSLFIFDGRANLSLVNAAPCGSGA